MAKNMFLGWNNQGSEHDGYEMLFLLHHDGWHLFTNHGDGWLSEGLQEETPDFTGADKGDWKAI